VAIPVCVYHELCVGDLSLAMISESLIVIRRCQRFACRGRSVFSIPTLSMIDGMPSEVGGWDVVVPPNLVNPSVARTAWLTVRLAT